MLLYWISPLLVALVPIAFKIKQLRFAVLWIVIAYVLLALGIALVPPFLRMIETGAGDPRLMAGQASQSLVTSTLLAVINTPLALLVFLGVKKLRTKA